MPSYLSIHLLVAWRVGVGVAIGVGVDMDGYCHNFGVLVSDDG